MSQFAGNIISSDVNNHVFVINHPVFLEYGCVTFSSAGWKIFAKSDFGKQVIASAGLTANDSSILTTFNLTTGSYYSYNGKNYAQTNIAKTSLEGDNGLINFHERKHKLSSGAADPAKKKLINDINGSLNGCVRFYAAGNTTDPLISLYFYVFGTRKNDRICTIKGSPYITDVPRLPSGKTIGYRYTLGNRSKTTGGFLNIGVYLDASEDNTDDVNNTVTAPLKISFNESLGRWDIQNQILARLLDDLDPVTIKLLDTEQPFDNTKPSEWYDKNSDKYLGGHTVAAAIPLSVQSSNPEMFGPNLLKYNDNGTVKHRLDQIKVVNRSSASFKKGDLVFCSFIGPEWVVQSGGGSAGGTVPLKTGRWGFYKFIANSDMFFRVDETDAIDSTKGGKLILPEDCQNMLRCKFFTSFSDSSTTSALATAIANKTTIASLNNAGRDTPLYKLHPYIQISSFDHSDASRGGTASKNYYKNIKIQGDEAHFSSTPLYWGPVFPDGYTSDHYPRLNGAPTDQTMKECAEYGPRTTDDDDTVSKHRPYTSDFLVEGGVIKTITDSFGSDRNFIQLPADIATNGKYSETSFPLESASNFIQYAINTNTFATSINSIMNSGYGYFLGNSTDYAKNVYGFYPVNPLTIQFSPLCAELVGSDDPASDTISNFDRRLKVLADLLLSNMSITRVGSLFGNLYTRLSNMGLSSLTTLTRNGKCGTNYTVPPSPSGIPYDCYVKYKPLNYPRAATQLFSDFSNPDYTGSNTVGIIAARVTITKNGGGPLNISAKQYFGLNGPTIGGTGQGNVNVVGLGDIGSWTTGGGPTLAQKLYAIWGSTNSDSIDSFGTVCLYGMVWDYWPEKQTVFIPQYFTVLHFNAGTLFSKADQDTAGVDKITWSDLDFRIPTTMAEAKDDGKSPQDGDTPKPKVRTAITADTMIGAKYELAPQEQWLVNTIRRGQLVTDPGFLYPKLVIGFPYSGSRTINKKGKKFSNGEIIKLASDLEIIVTADSDGGVVGISFVQENVPNFNVSYYKRGSGYGTDSFTKDDNGVDVVKLTISPKDPEGEEAVIHFSSLQAYEQYKVDAGPKRRCPITRLSSSSGEGKLRVDETKDTELSLDDNSDSKYPGKYEAFFFFQNDIGVVYHTNLIEGIVDFAQHITMTIS